MSDKTRFAGRVELGGFVALVFLGPPQAIGDGVLRQGVMNVVLVGDLYVVYAGNGYDWDLLLSGQPPRVADRWWSVLRLKKGVDLSAMTARNRGRRVVPIENPLQIGDCAVKGWVDCVNEGLLGPDGQPQEKEAVYYEFLTFDEAVVIAQALEAESKRPKEKRATKWLLSRMEEEAAKDA